MADLPSVISIGSLTADQGTLFVASNTFEVAGRSVQIIGDINGDGLADILIGAYRNSVSDTQAGAVYVVFGKEGGFDAASFSLANLNGSDGFRISGIYYDQTGQSVAGLVDFNGDGYNDLIIDGRGDYSGDGRGDAYVILGGPAFAASMSVSSLDGTNGFRVEGAAAGWQMGWAVSSAGDFNGDGLGDLMMSSIHVDSNRGATYVLFGQDDEFAPLQDIYFANPTQGVFILGEATGDSAGFSVASAGDINNDGADDLIIGSPGRGTQDGAAYIVFGRDGMANPFDEPINLADLTTTGQGLRISGLAGSDANFGRSVASVGDVNGDGVTDVVVGAHQDGMAYVLFGGAHLTDNFNIADLTPSLGFSLTYAPGGFFGASVSSAGDINGDGFDDLVVGAYMNQANNAGSAFVIMGRADFGAGLDVATASGVTRIDGQGPSHRLGRSVSGGGDVNGDGRSDLLIGIPYYGATAAGAAVLIYAPQSPVDYVGTSGADVETGGALADTLSGNGGADELSGLDGDDILNGGDGSDKLYGGLGADDLVGGIGGDLLDGGAGADQMAGGAGDDTYVVDNIGDTVAELGGEGVDRVRASISYTLGADLENLQLTGTANINGAGNALANQIDGNSGDNILSGGGGNDVIRGNGGLDGLNGEDGNDQLLGGDGNDELYGGDASDILSGGADSDLLYGGAGLDTLDGGTGADLLYGEAGADQMQGGDGDDQLFGGADNDVLRGGTGNDILAGGTGDDTYVVDDYSDTLTEASGEGSDIVKATVTWTLGANFERLILEGAGDIAGTGNGEANQITGNGGANVLDGGAGADILNGGLGADTLIGGTGGDTLIGGGGNDIFLVRQESVFTSANPQGRTIETDSISDYVIGQDEIDLSDIDAIAATGGVNDAFTMVGAFDGHAGQMTLSFAGGLTTLSLDVDGDRSADYRLRINGDVRGDTAGWLL